LKGKVELLEDLEKKDYLVEAAPSLFVIAADFPVNAS
jgi:hypothetical protein